jgi:formylglycine-generating enzyme required for sulfatase activity
MRSSLVSWDDANEFVSWLNRKTGKIYRLLSEAEWEYAARAGTTTIFYWGNKIGQNNAHCNGCDLVVSTKGQAFPHSWLF